MEKKEKVVLFHLYRRDGTALFLHPFENLDKLLQVLKKGEILGKYGKEPRVESIVLFRNDLYRMVEAAVKNQVAEAKFIPRFLIAAVVFLLSYVFLSVVIRDPLPIFDEVIVSSILAVISYFFINRRDQRSNATLRARVQYRTAVDRIVFQEDSFVREIEEALQQNETESREKVLEEMITGIEKNFTIADEGDAKQLIDYLEKRFSTKEYRKQEKLLGKLKSESPAPRSVEAVSRWSESKKIDLSLFAIYRRMKRSHRRVR